MKVEGEQMDKREKGYGFIDVIECRHLLHIPRLKIHSYILKRQKDGMEVYWTDRGEIGEIIVDYPKDIKKIKFIRRDK